MEKNKKFSYKVIFWCYIGAAVLIAGLAIYENFIV